MKFSKNDEMIDTKVNGIISSIAAYNPSAGLPNPVPKIKIKRMIIKTLFSECLIVFTFMVCVQMVYNVWAMSSAG